MKTIVKSGLVFSLISFATILAASNENIKDNDTISLPLRVYLVSFEALPELNSTYDQSKINLALNEINKLWGQWDINWQLEKTIPLVVNQQVLASIDRNETPRSFRMKMSRILASQESNERLWKLAIIKQFPVPASGVYMAERQTVLFGELNKHGEEHFSILAHELGHALGLDHVSDTSNLMVAGKTKDPRQSRQLTPEQIEKARAQALVGPAKGKKRQMNLTQERRERNEKLQKGGKNAMIIKKLQRFDRNGDGNITREELPYRARKAHDAFDRIDVNSDEVVDAAEVERFIAN